MLDIFERAKLPLSTAIYKDARPLPIRLHGWTSPSPQLERQYILRMVLRTPDTFMLVPPELEWLRQYIAQASWHHYENFYIESKYVYVTVRHGLCTSITDDAWHVDGFSMRKSHIPEQNYIYVGGHPTEFLDQSFAIPEDFDPLKHNIHQLFADRAEPACIWLPPTCSWLLLDPYCVHRRPPETFGKPRTMIRITFSPIAIEDDANTVNPWLRVKMYNNSDFREELTRYV